MSNPENPYAESDFAESQRKAFQGIGCAAGALAFPAPFLFGFPGGLGMVPVLVIVGLVFMFLAMAAKRRRDRIVWTVAQNQKGPLAQAPNIQPISLPPLDASTTITLSIPATPVAKPSTSADSEEKLTQRLNKAKKAGL